MYWTLEVLLVTLIIFVCTQIDFIFKPIGIFISTLFTPVLISGFLFYLLNPLVNLLAKIQIFKKHRGLAALLVISLLVLLLIGALCYLIPQIVTQIEQLMGNLPGYLSDLQHYLKDLSHKKAGPSWLKNIDFQSVFTTIRTYIEQKFNTILATLSSSIGAIFGAITSVTITLVTVPFMLFYMLKDGQKLLPAIKNKVPMNQADKVGEILSKMSGTISKYISGQVIECLFVGTFLAIGYHFVGIKYALLVGVFAGLMIVLPYVGPYIGLVPALLLALPMGMKTVILTIIVCIVVQQIDGNLVYPNVIGKTLDIHPLTIIVLLLVAGNLAGLIGMIITVPLYAVVKTLVQYLYDIHKLNKETKQKEA
ncbi:hypothetical protein IV53_GL000283 [Ligilactobacillus ceti DSM 22408]|uniref:Permease n=2 Tax=Ligilactobacillus TaxID=2767887 RepID=A0A0R2KLU9_9LACO|nr:AI-2E family transporter [Ligilactobacillus ceti]KRN90368.1 hypothetical protein IV53_GL000283 [Ligilactobacillus ceti DSM 22408]